MKLEPDVCKGISCLSAIRHFETQDCLKPIDMTMGTFILDKINSAH